MNHKGRKERKKKSEYLQQRCKGRKGRRKNILTRSACRSPVASRVILVCSAPISAQALMRRQIFKTARSLSTCPLRVCCGGAGLRLDFADFRFVELAIHVTAVNRLLPGRRADILRSTQDRLRCAPTSFHHAVIVCFSRLCSSRGRRGRPPPALGTDRRTPPRLRELLDDAAASGRACRVCRPLAGRRCRAAH